jgi:hypothetical protein
MKKLICIAIVSLGIVSVGFSQYSGSNQNSNYQSSIGVRFGTGYYDVFSASYKTFLAATPGALELNLGFRPDSYDGYDAFSVSFEASYQYHFNIAPVPGLKWFIGGGLSFYNTSVDNKYNNNDYTYSSGFGMGIFPTGGVDYKFANIPLAVSADLRPTIGLIRPNDYYNYEYVSFGISARYTIR